MRKYPPQNPRLNVETEADLVYKPPLYRLRPSEAEIQAELYCDILMMGLEPRIEVSGMIINRTGSNMGKFKKVRFDVVVFWEIDGKPICIIEVKRYRTSKHLDPQMKLYKGFNIPIINAHSWNHDEVIAEVYKNTIDRSDIAPKDFNWERFHSGYEDKRVFKGKSIIFRSLKGVIKNRSHSTKIEAVDIMDSTKIKQKSCQLKIKQMDLM